MAEDKKQSIEAAEPFPPTAPLTYTAMAILGAIFAAIGFVYAWLPVYVGIGLTGGGHGWGGGLLAFWCIVAIPLLGFAWGFFRSRLADLFMAPVLTYAVFADAIFCLTLERNTYLRYPGGFQVFFVLWGLWQIPLFVLLVVRLKGYAYNLGRQIRQNRDRESGSSDAK